MRDDIRRSTREDRYSRSTRARVLRVDYETLRADMTWEEINGGTIEVPLSVAHYSPRSVIMGMPETGSTVAAHFTKGDPHYSPPYISSYLPVGASAGINQRLQSDQKEELPGIKSPKTRRKFRKIYPGELIMSSTYGVDALFDEQIHLYGRKGEEFRIDDRDGSINQISLQNYKITDASRSFDGWIYRTIEEGYDSSGNLVNTVYSPDTRQPFITDESSKKRWYRTISGDKSVDDYVLEPSFTSAPLVESRKEIREVGYGLVPLVDQNVDCDLWWRNNVTENFPTQSRGNIIEVSSGTLVGYDPFHSNYGKVLRPIIFSNPDGTNLDIKEIPITEDQAPDYSSVRLLAAAHMWKMPYSYSQTRMYVTKEGQIHMHVGSTFAAEDQIFDPQIEHPHGAGRSVDANFAGSIKVVIDKNKKREESIDLKTIGKFYYHFGKDDAFNSAYQRSLFVDGKPFKGSVPNPVLSSASGLPPTATHNSIEGVTDGGVTLRIGRNHGRNLRVFEQNGFTADGIFERPNISVRNVNRLTYEVGDKFYRHHDLKQIAVKAPGRITPQDVNGEDPASVSDPNFMGSSLDAHLVGNAFIRLGQDGDGNSLIMDLKGGIAAWIGADRKGNRSLSLTMNGGIEFEIGRNRKSGRSLQGYLDGGIDLIIRGGQDGQDIKVAYQGDRYEETDGKIIRVHRGPVEEQTFNDYRQQVGANYNLSIGNNQQTSVTNASVLSIGNAALESVARSVKAFVGTIEHRVETKGDIFMETRIGKIIAQTLLGDAEFRSMVGRVVVEALAGNTDILALNKVRIGKPLLPKYGVVTSMTGCLLTGGSVPHIFGSHDVYASDIPLNPLPPLPEIV